jgi:endonuclease I
MQSPITEPKVRSEWHELTGNSQIIGKNRAYGQCDFKIDFDRDIVEPRWEIKGDIMRLQLYLKPHVQHNVSGFKFDAYQRA